MTAVATRIAEMTSGYLPAMVVFAAVDVGLFDALTAPRSFAELAASSAASPDGIARLCRALASLGLVTLAGDIVTAEPAARAALARDGEGSLVGLVQMHRRLLLPPALQLGDAVRTGAPQHAAWPFADAPVASSPYDELARHPAELRALVLGMDHDSAGVGAAIARTVDLGDARLLVDLGCGGGVVARELLAAVPALRIVSVDSAAACDVARARSAAQGLAARHVFEPGDARRGVAVRDADVVLLSALLADFPRAERATILRHARTALRPGGRVLVSETLLADDRCGPPRAALLSLLTLAVTRGDQLSGAELIGELEDAGFEAPVIHRGEPRDLVVAVTPR